VYVGAANLPDDGGYSGKVLSEQAYLQQVSAGKTVSVTVVHTGAATPARTSSVVPVVPELDAALVQPGRGEQLAMLRRP
jgi:hypothetical protein